MAPAKQRVVYSCTHCGHQTPKWAGRCLECQKWGTLDEELQASGSGGPKTASGLKAVLATPAIATPLAQVPASATQLRLATGLSEFDRVLGGGLVVGSAVLIGGTPGIGKSTLLLQAAGALSAKSTVLYACAEESLQQVKLRADRLGVNAENLLVTPETNIASILQAVEQSRASVLLVDSLQAVYDPSVDSAPGTMSQVRQVAARLVSECKRMDAALLLVGHVTKDGSIAGPRMVEHLVDTVLYFEESAGYPYRLLRAVKNRFGSTNELGVFSMADGGLTEITNPSELFLAERATGASGSAVAAAIEGTRALLVEIQALASHSTFGTPRRTALGIDPSRAGLILAILEKKASLAFAELDTYVNVAGGVRLREPAADLPTALALASSILDKPIDPKLTVFGELGLTGEVRAVTQAERRVKESAKLGFERVIAPKANAENLAVPRNMEVIGVASVREAIYVALNT